MKAYDELWESALCVSQPLDKRYKAFTSIKKACRDSGEDIPRYKKILNDYAIDIFDLATSKLAK